eukprot:3412223-Rhodomonas_salina.2
MHARKDARNEGTAHICGCVDAVSASREPHDGNAADILCVGNVQPEQVGSFAVRFPPEKGGIEDGESLNVTAPPYTLPCRFQHFRGAHQMSAHPSSLPLSLCLLYTSPSPRDRG